MHVYPWAETAEILSRNLTEATASWVSVSTLGTEAMATSTSGGETRMGMKLRKTNDASAVGAAAGDDESSYYLNDEHQGYLASVAQLRLFKVWVNDVLPAQCRVDSAGLL